MTIFLSALCQTHCEMCHTTSVALLSSSSAASSVLKLNPISRLKNDVLKICMLHTYQGQVEGGHLRLVAIRVVLSNGTNQTKSVHFVLIKL